MPAKNQRLYELRSGRSDPAGTHQAVSGYLNLKRSPKTCQKPAFYGGDDEFTINRNKSLPN
jgi:hypothetical protein